MKKGICIRFASVRQANDFYSLNRKYREKVNISVSGEKECDEVNIVAEGSEAALHELFRSYRVCGIAG